MRNTALGLVTLFMLSVTILAQHGHDAGGETVSLKGEVIGMQCYLTHPDNSRGEGHAKCARLCINKGLPIGFLDEDGTLYSLIGPGHDSLKDRVADLAGQKVAITATPIERNGLKALQLKSIEVVTDR